MKCIIAAVSLVFITITSVAQPAYSDLMNALYYSQNGPAHAAFDGSGQYYNYYWGHTSSNNSGSSVSRATPRRRTATNMSNVGLKTSSSGYNRGAELARFYAEQRAERARREAERRERMIASYMEKRYAASQERGAMAKAYIYDNSNAKPLSEEAINDIISNGLSGNFIIDDDGDQYFLPEYLLEGSEISDNTLEILEEKLKNGEELSDEEWDILIAQKKEEIARLEEEKRQLEEANRNAEEELDNNEENLSNQSFDDISKIQYNELSKNTNESDDNTLKSRNEIDPDEADLDEINLEEVDLDKPLYVNSVNASESPEKYTNVSERDGLVFPIDSERIKNQERDERWEKIKKEFLSDSEKKDSKSKTFEDNLVSLDIVGSVTVYSATTAAGKGFSDGDEIDYDMKGMFEKVPTLIDDFKVGAMAVKSASEGQKRLATTFGDDIVPKSELLDELNEGINKVNAAKKVKGMLVNAFSGNRQEALSDYMDIVKEKAFDPLKDCAIGLGTNITGAYKTMKRVFDFGDVYSNIVNNTWNGVKEEMQAVLRGENPDRIRLKTEQKAIYNVHEYISNPSNY